MKGVTGEANRGDFDKTATAEIVTRDVNLSGMTVVITGCNSGIGYETMRVLALRGAYVIGTARTMEKAVTACNNIEGVAVPMVMELSNFASVAKCADEIQAMNCPIDILICNASIRSQTAFHKISLEEWHRTLAVPLDGTFLCTRAAAPKMMEKKWLLSQTVSSHFVFCCFQFCDQTLFNKMTSAQELKVRFFMPFWDFGGSQNRPLERPFRPKRCVFR